MNMSTPRTREAVDIVDPKRWLAYATAGAAGAMVCQGVEASIIHVTVNQVLDASGGPGTTQGSLAFAVGAASSGSISFAHLANTSVGAAFFGASAANFGQFAGFSAAGYPYASNLAAGQNVSTLGFLSGTGTLAFTSGFGNSQFLGAGIGFLGFRFDGGLGLQHGWARVDMSGAPLNSYTIVDYAYTTEGERITAGQTPPAGTPAPGSLGLLAAGAAGLAIARRRRRKQAV
jgi:hypothetical protein